MAIEQAPPVARGEVQQHLDALNAAHHAATKFRRRECDALTVGEMVTASNEANRATERYRKESTWLYEAGYPLYPLGIFFQYDHTTDSYVWPE